MQCEHDNVDEHTKEEEDGTHIFKYCLDCNVLLENMWIAIDEEKPCQI